MWKSLCVFGDSIVWGANDSEKGGWPSRLRRYLEDNGYEIELYNLGISGDNTDGLLKRLDVECSAREANTVVIAIGINDSQYIETEGNMAVSLDRFRKNIQELIVRGKKLAEDVVFVGLTGVDEKKTMPIPWKTEIFYTEKNAALYDSELKKLCEKNNVPFIDMSRVLKKSDMPDGLHPDSGGHEKIFLKVRDFLISEKMI